MAIPKHITFTLSNERFTGINETQRVAIGNEIVNIIQNRTASGKDKDGNAFTPYNTSYTKSSHFKSSGKGSKVDLVFSDRMMNSLVYLPDLSSGSRITVGFRNGSEENNRAQYNIEGHGRKGDSTQPKRNPMGLTTSETNTVVDMVPQGGNGAVFLALTAGFLASIF
jgi:hypothetical protein